MATYECVNCGYREERNSTEPVLERACPKCGGDMIIVSAPQEELQRREVEEATGYSEPSGFFLPWESFQMKNPPQELDSKLREFYSLKFVEARGDMFVYVIEDVLERDFERVLREVESVGYWIALRKGSGGETYLFAFPAQEPKRSSGVMALILFLATVVTTLIAGYSLSLGYASMLKAAGLRYSLNPYLDAVAFSASVMGILGTHEMAHKIAARRHGIRATFPYFIPFPNILGTLGAMIRIKSPIPTRDAAVDLGASGPIAGFLVAIPVTIIGLHLSTVVPASTAGAISSGNGLYIGQNLLMLFLESVVLNVPKNSVLLLHPIAIAGWIGILVTFLNLIPAAQLDGGHIAGAILGERLHRYFTIGLALTMMFMAPLWYGWVIWGILIMIMGMMGNPGPLDGVSPISRKRKLIILAVVIIFILSATPVPLRYG
ncbi:MAG: site-2 protease family protein [Thermococci archaeon]|nr:site-2 protease family protein [Thermococci archaeon]